jgi:hypothetical protein
VRGWVTGGVLLAVGLVGLVTYQSLVWAHPHQWGTDSDIGGGGIVLVSAAFVLGGLLTLVRAVRAARARRAAGERIPRTGRIVRGGVLALDGALVVALVTISVASPGSSSGVDGQVGVTVDAAGAPVLLLEVCRGSLDVVTVVGPNVDGRNEQYARLVPPTPITASMTVSLSSPPSGWTVEQLALPLAGHASLLLIASAYSDDGQELLQADFTPEQLATLDPDTVQHVALGRSGPDGFVDTRSALAGFHDEVCSSDRFSG